MDSVIDEGQALAQAPDEVEGWRCSWQQGHPNVDAVVRFADGSCVREADGLPNMRRWNSILFLLFA